jgi:hypothetical protein
VSGDPGDSARSGLFAEVLPVVITLLIILALVAEAGGAAARRGVWFCGDFEMGGLHGWAWDRARPESIAVVTQPVRKGRYAVRVSLAPGDIAASKERAELKIGDRAIERVRGRQGGEMWYGWSLLVPADYADPPGEHFQILGQWHHRPAESPVKGRVAHGGGPPPLILHLAPHDGRHVLTLIGRAFPGDPGRKLGARPVRQGAWTDLVFHVRWSTGNDGFVEAWLDGRPFTAGKVYGPTLYSPVSNYLRLGLYRGKGFSTTNHVYYDEVRIGDSYQAVAP